MSSSDSSNVDVPEIENLFKYDPYLKPHEKEIRRRWVVGHALVKLFLF